MYRDKQSWVTETRLHTNCRDKCKLFTYLLTYLLTLLMGNAVVTREIKLLWNNFAIISVFYFTCSHVWNWNEIISAAERVLKSFQNYFSDNEHVGKYSWTAISLRNNFDTRQPVLISQRRSPTPHFWGCAPRGSMTPKFELGRDFCTTHLPPSFIILYLFVRKLSCWQTNKHTHKQTDAAENIQRSSLRYDVG